MAARLYAVAFVNSFNIFSCSYECQEAFGPLWQPDCVLFRLLIVFNIFSCRHEYKETVSHLWQPDCMPDCMLFHLLIIASIYSLVGNEYKETVGPLWQPDWDCARCGRENW